MKKILTILGTISLVATTTTTVVSCGNKGNNQINELKKQLEELQKQKEELIEDHSQQLQQKQKELEKLENEVSTKNLEIVNLNEKISQKEIQIADIQLKLDQLKVDFDDKETLLQEKHEEHQNLSKQHEKVNLDLKKLQIDFKDKTQRVLSHQTKIQELQTEIDSQNVAIEQKNQQLDLLIKQNKLDETRIDALSNLLQEAKLKNHNLETQIINLNTKVEKNNSLIDELKNLVQTLTVEKQKLVSELSESQQKVKDFETNLQYQVWSDLDNLLEHYNITVQLEQKSLEIKAELETKKQSLEQKNQQLEAAVKQNQALSQTIASLQKENRQVKTDFDKAKTDLINLNKTVGEKATEIVNLKAQNQNLINSKAALKKSLETSQKQNAQLTTLKLELEQQLKQKAIELNNKKAEITALKVDKKNLNSQVTNLEAKLATAVNEKATMQQENDTLKQQKDFFENRYNSLKKEYEEISKSFRFKDIFKKELEPAFWSLLDTQQKDLKFRQEGSEYNRKEQKNTDKNFYKRNWQSKAQFKKQNFLYSGIREFLLEFLGEHNLERDSKYWMKLENTNENKEKYHNFQTWTDSDNHLVDLANPNNLKLVQSQMQLWLNSLKTNSNYHQNYFGRAKYWINLLNPVVNVYYLTKKDPNVMNLVNYLIGDKEKMDAKSTRIEILLKPEIKTDDSAEDKLIKKLVYGDKRFFDLAKIDITNDWWENQMYTYNEDGPGKLTFNPKDFNRGQWDNGYYSNNYSIRVKKIEERWKNSLKNDRLSLINYHEKANWFISIKLNK